MLLAVYLQCITNSIKQSTLSNNKTMDMSALSKKDMQQLIIYEISKKNPKYVYCTEKKSIVYAF